MLRLTKQKMIKPTVDEILTPKPETRPRIYAYAIAEAAHQCILKVGHTTRDVSRRADQLRRRSRGHGSRNNVRSAVAGSYLQTN